MIGLVTKDDFEMALRDHQVSKGKTKSKQRNKAKLAKAHMLNHDTEQNQKQAEGKHITKLLEKCIKIDDLDTK